MKIGAHIQKVHPHDGSSRAGLPLGPLLTVVAIEDHAPVDGRPTRGVIAVLSDGTWAFVWTLYERNADEVQS